MLEYLANIVRSLGPGAYKVPGVKMEPAIDQGTSVLVDRRA